LAAVSMKQLLEAGVHFGHQTRRWNPKMRDFIFGERNGIHIIDLAQTVTRLDAALEFVRETIRRGDSILFVGTKKQAQESIATEAERCGQHYVNNRWLGGIRRMRRVPGALFIVDPHRESIAVLEARRLEIPIVAITDTNCDPDQIDWVIPANDDAIRSVRLISAQVADAALEAQAERQARLDEEFEQAEALPPVDDAALVADADYSAALASGEALVFEPEPEEDEEEERRARARRAAEAADEETDEDPTLA